MPNPALSSERSFSQRHKPGLAALLQTDRWQALHPHLLYPSRSTCFSLSYLQSPIMQWTFLLPSPHHWGPFIIKPTTWLSPVCCNHRQPKHVIDGIQASAATFNPDKCHSSHSPCRTNMKCPSFFFLYSKKSVRHHSKRVGVKDITDALGLYIGRNIASDSQMILDWLMANAKGQKQLLGRSQKIQKTTLWDFP